jgi:hypothetical protein
MGPLSAFASVAFSETLTDRLSRALSPGRAVERNNADAAFRCRMELPLISHNSETNVHQPFSRDRVEFRHSLSLTVIDFD